MKGSTRPFSPRIHAGLHDGPVSLAALDWAALGECGAEACFLGRTRAEIHPQFGALQRLEYEAYGPMAARLLDEMARTAALQWGAHAVRLVHASGIVPVGEPSIVIQVATPHRAEAFGACRDLIERIKHELPIWKREIWEHGTTFVEGCCVKSENSHR
ncbi:MAG: molybdenum cofactor biosynthesis protein MoaE [Phycisphaeraceae bacterium]